MRRLASLTFLFLLGAPIVAQGPFPVSCGCGAKVEAWPWGTNPYIGTAGTTADCVTNVAGTRCRVVGVISLITTSWSGSWGTFYFNGYPGTGGNTYTSYWGLPLQDQTNPGFSTSTTYVHTGSGTEVVCDQPGALVGSFLFLSGDRVDSLGAVVQEDLFGSWVWPCEEF